MRRIGIFIAVVLTGCFRNLDFAPCQEDPSQPICFDSGTTDSSSIDSGEIDTGDFETASDSDTVETTTDSGALDSDLGDTIDATDGSEAGACTGPSMQTCGKCGTQTRTCTDAIWSAWSTCSGEKECTPGDVMAGTGTCPGALEKKSKTCSAACGWSPEACSIPKGWSAIAAIPAAYGGRFGHTAVWTGTELITWGGIHAKTDSAARRDGARFNPSTNTWTMLPDAPASLAGRTLHTAVWTGSEMIVWGGESIDSAARYADGAAYKPSTNTWRTLAAPMLAARSEHAAVWTGSAMLVWGGANGTDFVDGASYDPGTDKWTTIPNPLIAARNRFAYAWTGSELIVWGGRQGDKTYLLDGAKYEVATKTWTKFGSASLGNERIVSGFGRVGSELVIFGGGAPTATTPVTFAALSNGLRLSAAGTYVAISTPSAAALSPAARLGPATWCSATGCYFW
ncbi:MAG: Kelch repeat-containing protein, partial [Polyangiales bacterium]